MNEQALFQEIEKAWELRGIDNAYAHQLLDHLQDDIHRYQIDTQGKFFLAKGALYNNENNHNNALEYLLKANICFIEADNLPFNAKCLNKIGRVFTKQKQYDKAILYFNESLLINEKAKNKKGIFINYMNLGRLFLSQKSYESALKYFAKTLDYYDAKTIGQEKHAYCLFDIGDCQFGLKNYTTAQSYLQKALNISKKIQHIPTTMSVYLRLIDINIILKSWENIPSLLKAGIQLSQDIKHLAFRSKILERAGNYYRHIGEIETSLIYYSNCIELLKDTNSSTPQQTIALIDICIDICQNQQNTTKENFWLKEKISILSEQESTRTGINTDFIHQSIHLQDLETRINKLESTNHLLSQANQDLELFAGRASHDLKEPIRMIHSFAELIAKDPSALSTKHKQFLDIIITSAQQMQELVNDLITYVQISGTGYETKVVNLNNTLTLVEQQLKLPIQQSSATIKTETLPSIVINSSHAFQIFSNLISNSIKYAKQNQAPTIDIKYQLSNNTHKITYQDNGIEIKEEFFKKVFLPFTRLHAKSKIDGSGLGLATCKKAIQSIGGNIFIAKSNELGTTFTLEIPAN